MKKIINLFLIFMCLVSLCACTKNEINDIDKIDYPTIDLVDKEDVFINDDDFSLANNQYSNFVSKLFKETYKENDNGLVSPYSLYSVLSILANGASESDKASTKLLMENVLGLTVNDLNKLYQITSKNLTLYNSLLFNTSLGLSIDEETKNTIIKYYGDVIKEEKFDNNIIDEVNKWCSDKTNGLIDSIIDKDDIDETTVLLLLNALNVQGNFDIKFNSNNTTVEEFTNNDNSKVDVNMMHQTLDGYWESEDAKGFVKSLDSGYYFVGILPKNNLDSYIKGIDSNTISDFINSYIKYENYDEENNVDMHYTRLSFPKFEFSFTNDLNETLKNIGLNPLFDYNTCDFSLFGSNLIYLDKVKQKTNILVDEEKVEMSAVTIVEANDGSYMPPNIRKEIYHDVVFDKPFAYCLVKQMNENEYIILFTGFVNEMENINGN